MVYEGIATMYLAMPMSQQMLPVFGSCTVDGKKISLKFPLSGVSFDLPEAPAENSKDMEFKMSGGKGELTLNISYKADMKGFVGAGKQDGQTVLSFVFYDADSPLKHLKML